MNVGPETYSKETVGDFRFIANFAPPPSARRSGQCGAHACSLHHRVVTMALDEALPVIELRIHSKSGLGETLKLSYFDHSRNDADQERRRKSGAGAEKQV